ncbi:hypothetical protein MLD38_039584 [Melastoma candidum]|nr:hypothetical protein MLD38_039584 [Melastoma candidum]
MIRAYTNNGQWSDALALYSLMRRSGVWPNNYTYPFVLKACGHDPSAGIWSGKTVHGELIRNGLESDLYVEAALVIWYAKCGELNDGRKVFDGMTSRDLVCWTTMITAYEQAELPRESLMMFGFMQQQQGILADSVTVVSVASAVGQLGNVKSARSVHAHALCCGILEDVCGGNAIVAMYGKCGDVESARMAFDRMEERDIISWNAVLSGFVQNGQAREAFSLFELMKESGCRPNPLTALIMLSACSFLGSCQLGMKIQGFLVDNKITVDLTLRNALIDMYAKCGDLETAMGMFNDIGVRERDVTSWNVMIAALGTHGRGKEALDLYLRMQEEGVRPNHITFVSVLSACSHAGLIDEGKNCFADMQRFSVKQEVKHYACMVDMLGRAGLLNEAFDLVRTMPSPPNDGVWGALLLACRVQGNSELGEVAANNLFLLEPEHPGYYVLMSNVYAASRKWHEVGNLRTEMKSRGLMKPAAVSMIEYRGEIVGFQTADWLNPFRHEAYKKLEGIAVEMKSRGYFPDRSCVLHDVEEEDKDHILNYHSEKLAVAFGIIKSEAGSTITVMKNLRICCDCHSAFKLISDIYRRRIVVRDGNRFHHFEAGSCSCNDYW